VFFFEHSVYADVVHYTACSFRTVVETTYSHFDHFSL